MDTPTNVLSICSGIAGLDHGLRLACPTARPVCLVEGEAFAIACLVAQMRRGELAEAPIWTDLATFDGRPWRGVVDTVVGGFPCQPASVAGRRRGTDDERWLWDHVERVIGEVQPRWVFLENVPGLLSAPGPGMGGADTGGSVRGGAMGAVLRGLATMGFDAEWCCVPASAVGSPQGRMRWFCLAHRPDGGFFRGTEQDQRTQGREPASRRGDANGCHPAVGNANRELYDRGGEPGQRGRGEPSDSDGLVGNAHSTGSQIQPDAGSTNADKLSAMPTGSEMGRVDSAMDAVPVLRGMALQHPHHARQRLPVPTDRGVDDQPLYPPGPQDDAAWELVLAAHPELAPAIPTEPAFCRVAPGSPVVVDNAGRVDRLRALGNCVVPQQAALAFRILWERLLTQDVHLS